MKKKYIAILALVVIAGGVTFWLVRRAQASKDPPASATLAKVQHGNIRATVASNGRVVANLDVDIKCKASGEIIALPFDISDSVQKDQLLMELDPNDQERILRQEDAALKASQARLVSAQRNLEVAERTLDTDKTKGQSDLQSAQAKAQDARAKANRTKQLFDKKLSSKEEYETAETAAVQAAAGFTTAQVKLEELKTQEIALELKRQDVKLAEAQVESDTIARQVASDRLNDTKVSAPMDGVVSARSAQIGQIISSGISNVGGGTTVLTLSDLSRIFVYASVDESDVGRVRVGQKVDIFADAFPGRTFQGQVVRIATRGTNVSNVVTFEVRIEVIPDSSSAPAHRRRGSASQERGETTSKPSASSQDAPGADRTAYAQHQAASEPAAHRWGSGDSEPSASTPVSTVPAGTWSQNRFLLKPEMTTNLEIVVAQKDNVLIVPSEAVQRKAGKFYATVVKDGGTNQDVEVQTGITDGTNTEIVGGLEEGQTVLVRKGAADSRWNGGQRPGQGGAPRGLMMPGGMRGR